ncbi:MAG: hypothetical protein COA96_14155 [SAR86 cluster bacterium]|uniref:Uncharacterized protein n=1 Tax=SAR86 cluster bacterium TaxID=2030880 RepID=A0A2A5AUR7_9GAMM|nr:MAG: hypothetical protein COA96_14155 [SAR86 cluster bacterium]
MRLNFSEGLNFKGSIVPSAKPKINIDGGPTLDELTIVTTLAADEFTLLIDIGTDRRVEITGQELLDREAYEGRAATAGQFVLSFVDALARTLQGEMLTGLVTRPDDRVILTLEVEAGVVGTKVATLYMETSPNRPEEFRLYILPESVQVTKIGKNPFAGFRQGTRPEQNYIRRVFAYGAITHASVKQDRKTTFGEGELPKAVNDARLLRNGKTVPTSSTCFVLDPVVRGNSIYDLWDTYNVEAMRVTFTTSDTNDIRALTEYVQDMRDEKAK